jgi:hypothetical protein
MSTSERPTQQLAGAERIVLIGGPRVGKSTKAAELALDTGHLVWCSDEYRDVEWSKASALAMERLETPGPWILEGCAMVRALRKWLKAHPEGRPCDLLLARFEPREKVSFAQQTMGKGVKHILIEIRRELALRGVRFGSF